jgi:hypothetical protein
VISNELLRYYEFLIANRKPVPPQENPHLREYIAEIRDAWETRVILRDLRNRTGLATCSGEVDCLESPTLLCMRGAHPTCGAHTDSCYLCMPQGKLEFLTSVFFLDCAYRKLHRVVPTFCASRKLHPAVLQSSSNNVGFFADCAAKKWPLPGQLPSRVWLR